MEIYAYMDEFALIEPRKGATFEIVCSLCKQTYKAEDSGRNLVVEEAAVWHGRENERSEPAGFRKRRHFHDNVWTKLRRWVAVCPNCGFRWEIGCELTSEEIRESESAVW